MCCRSRRRSLMNFNECCVPRNQRNLLKLPTGRPITKVDQEEKFFVTGEVHEDCRIDVSALAACRMRIRNLVQSKPCAESHCDEAAPGVDAVGATDRRVPGLEARVL